MVMHGSNGVAVHTTSARAQRRSKRQIAHLCRQPHSHIKGAGKAEKANSGSGNRGLAPPRFPDVLSESTSRAYCGVDWSHTGSNKQGRRRWAYCIHCKPPKLLMLSQDLEEYYHPGVNNQLLGKCHDNQVLLLLFHLPKLPTRSQIYILDLVQI